MSIFTFKILKSMHQLKQPEVSDGYHLSKDPKNETDTDRMKTEKAATSKCSSVH